MIDVDEAQVSLRAALRRNQLQDAKDLALQLVNAGEPFSFVEEDESDFPPEFLKLTLGNGVRLQVGGSTLPPVGMDHWQFLQWAADVVESVLPKWGEPEAAQALAAARQLKYPPTEALYWANWADRRRAEMTGRASVRAFIEASETCYALHCLCHLNVMMSDPRVPPGRSRRSSLEDLAWWVGASARQVDPESRTIHSHSVAFVRRLLERLPCPPPKISF